MGRIALQLLAAAAVPLVQAHGIASVMASHRRGTLFYEYSGAAITHSDGSCLEAFFTKAATSFVPQSAVELPKS
jgi:hypothetical protein